MTPEERDRWWGEAKRRHKFVGEDVLQYDNVFEIVRAAVEEEREAWEAKHHHVLKYHTVGAENAGMCVRCDPKELSWATWSRQAGGKEKFCGCGQPSKDPVTGGCGEC